MAGESRNVKMATCSPHLLLICCLSWPETDVVPCPPNCEARSPAASKTTSARVDPPNGSAGDAFAAGEIIVRCAYLYCVLESPCGHERARIILADLKNPSVLAAHARRHYRQVGMLRSQSETGSTKAKTAGTSR
jgi:hypothetical protein